jgi:hypothetical protein
VALSEQPGPGVGVENSRSRSSEATPACRAHRVRGEHAGDDAGHPLAVVERLAPGAAWKALNPLARLRDIVAVRKPRCRQRAWPGACVTLSAVLLTVDGMPRRRGVNADSG